MSGFMRQLKNNNERRYSLNKQPIKYNQGSAVSQQATLHIVNTKHCNNVSKQVINSPNYPRSLNKLDARSCPIVCDASLVNYKKTNLSNRNLIDNRISLRVNRCDNVTVNGQQICANKNIKKQYKSNADIIDQIKSEN